MKTVRRVGLLLCLGVAALAAHAETRRLIVVEDGGGTSALPYYRALNLLPSAHDLAALPAPAAPIVPNSPYREADLLPVRSARLTPGPVPRRIIAAPGLMPTCLIGDDPLSRAWLKRRLPTLRALHAACLVVQISSAAHLRSLRVLAAGIPLVPASGDDIARRLALHHYPVLITATGIEP